MSFGLKLHAECTHLAGERVPHQTLTQLGQPNGLQTTHSILPHEKSGVLNNKNTLSLIAT